MNKLIFFLIYLIITSACATKPFNDQKKECENTGYYWDKNKGCRSWDQLYCEDNTNGIWVESEVECYSKEEYDCKQKGWIWSFYKCISPKQKSCEDKGYEWDDKKGCRSWDQLYCEDYTKGIWVESEKKCYDKDEYDCKQKGWSWEKAGNLRKYSCVQPKSPKEKCEDKGYEWDDKKGCKITLSEDECTKMYQDEISDCVRFRGKSFTDQQECFSNFKKLFKEYFLCDIPKKSLPGQCFDACEEKVHEKDYTIEDRDLYRKASKCVKFIFHPDKCKVFFK